MAIGTLTIDFRANLARLEQDIGRANQRLDRFASTVKSAFGGLALGLSAAGVTAFIKSTIDAADNLGKMSQRVGVTVENLSALQYAAKLSDVSTEQLSAGLGRLALNMQLAAAGSGEARRAFAALGISQQELAQLGTDEGLERIAEIFSSIEDGAGKVALARQIFGDAGSQLIPLLNSGSSGLAQFRAEAERLGIVISGETARAAEQFNDNLTRLQTATQGAGIALLNPLLPTLTKISETLAQAAQSGKLFEGVLRSIGELGKRALFGADKSGIEQQLGFIQGLRKEIASIEQKLEASEGGLISRLAFGSPDELRRKLAELRLTLEQARKSLAIQQQQEDQAAAARGAARKAAAPSIAAVGGGGGGNPDAALFEEARIAQGIQDRDFREFERRLDEIERLRLEVEREAEATKIALLKEGPEIAAAGASRDLAQLESRLGNTTSARVERLQRELQVLAAEGAKAPLELQERYSEAFEQINNELQALQGDGGGQFKKVADEGRDAFRQLEFAVRGFGTRVDDVFAQLVVNGKASFSDLARSVIADIARMTSSFFITQPLFGALANKFAVAGTPVGLASAIGARALGGPVSAGSPYLVGERGPELFVPRSSGQIVPNNALGGGGTVINVNVDARADRAAVAQDVRYAVQTALARDRDMRRRGG